MFRLPCPHGGHEHATGPEDASCFTFLLAQLAIERPVATARTGVVGPNGLRSGGTPNETERRRYDRALTTTDPGAAMTYRREYFDGVTRYARAQAVFPALATLNDQIAGGGRRALEVKWLKDSLHGVPVTKLAQRSGRDSADVRRAVNAAARRVCRNDVPRRFRDDLAVVASRDFGS